MNVPFSKHKAYYDVTVPKSVKNLDIQAYPADRSDMVQVIGAESMNDSKPVFVNILVTSPSEDTYSIYTLRLTYDNIFTPKYSTFQMTVCVLLSGAVLLAVGFFTSRFLCKRKMRRGAEGTRENVEVTRNVENESLPMV